MKLEKPAPRLLFIPYHAEPEWIAVSQKWDESLDAPVPVGTECFHSDHVKDRKCGAQAGCVTPRGTEVQKWKQMLTRTPTGTKQIRQ